MQCIVVQLRRLEMALNQMGKSFGLGAAPKQRTQENRQNFTREPS